MATKKLIIKVIEGRNLYKDDISPYVRVIGPSDKISTKTIPHNHTNPQWNEEMFMDIDISKENQKVIEFIVYHQAPLKRQFQGWVSVNVKDEKAFTEEGEWFQLANRPDKNLVGKMHKLTDKKDVFGQIRLSFKWMNLQSAPPVGGKPIRDSDKQGALIVKVIQAKSLQAIEKNGTSDPYCSVKFLKQKYKTPTVFANVNPTWNETFYFKSRGGVLPEFIEFKCKHDNMLLVNKSLGILKLPLSNLQPETPVESWYPLEGKTGMLRVSLEYEPLARAHTQKKLLSLRPVIDKTKNKMNHVSSDSQGILRAPVRLLVRASLILCERIKERGYQGTVVTLLGVLFLRVGWQVKTSDSEKAANRKEMSLTDEEKNKHGALARLVGWATDKIIDLLQIMCRQCKEMGYSAKIGARVSLGYIYPSSQPNQPGTPLNFRIGLSVQSDSVPLKSEVLKEIELKKIMNPEDEKVLDLTQEATNEHAIIESFAGTGKGGLIVKVAEAQNVKDDSPYCIVTVNKKPKHSSVAAKTSPNIVWNESFTFASPDGPPAFLEIEIRHDRARDEMTAKATNHANSSLFGKFTGVFHQDPLVGRVRINASDLRPNHPQEIWADLANSQGGKVKVIAEYDPGFEPGRAIGYQPPKKPQEEHGAGSAPVRFMTKVMVYATLLMRERAIERKFEGEVFSSYAAPVFSLTLNVFTSDTKKDAMQKINKATKGPVIVEEEEEEKEIQEFMKSTVALVVDRILDFIGIGSIEMQRQDTRGLISVGNTIESPVFAFTLGFRIISDSVPNENDRVLLIQDIAVEPPFSGEEEEKKNKDDLVTGGLIVSVVQAKSLPGIEKNHTTCNPYCIVKACGYRLKGSVMTENVNPIFNDVLVFPCQELPESIEVKVKHDNFFRGNVLLGKAQYPLNIAPRRDIEQGIDEWVPLDSKTGMVRLHVKFEPNRKVAVPERSLIGGLPGKAGRKFNVAGKKGLKSSIRAGFRVTVLAAKLLLKRMKERKLKGKGISMLTIFVTTLGIYVTTKKTKAITNRKVFEEDEMEEEKDNVLVQCVKALIDKLMDALSICAIEVQRLGCKGKLKVMVIGGLPPPYPAWFELSLAIELKTDSVQNLNDEIFSLGDQNFNSSLLTGAITPPGVSPRK